MTIRRPAPPELARKIADHSGALEGYRRFRNNVVLLVADGERVADLVQTAQRYLAIAQVDDDADVGWLQAVRGAGFAGGSKSAENFECRLIR